MFEREYSEPMHIIDIIESYYPPGTLAHRILITHSRLVTRKAVDVARNVPELSPDIDFIREAAMLHDIGIFKTHAPDIGCDGEAPYICHGILGREILNERGLPRHGLVCERHTGTGLTLDDITDNNLPLPLRDMTPVSIEEEIICFADKFFSKNPESYTLEKPIQEVLSMLKRFGQQNADTFLGWADKFKVSLA